MTKPAPLTPWPERPRRRNPTLEKIIALLTSPAAIAVAVAFLEYLLGELRKRHRRNYLPDERDQYYHDDHLN